MTKNIQTAVPQKVDYNDAVAESKVYFEGDDLAATVWVSKYALKDSYGNIYERSPKQMHERIAAEIERIEHKYPNPMSKEEVFSLLDHELLRHRPPQSGRLVWRYLPHGRGAGAAHEASRRCGSRPLAHPPHG